MSKKYPAEAGRKKFLKTSSATLPKPNFHENNYLSWLLHLDQVRTDIPFYTYYISCYLFELKFSFFSASGSGQGTIDNRIEQAMVS